MNVEALANRHLAEPSFFVPSDELLVRLISAYQSTQTSTGENGKIWQLIAGKQNELHDALLSGNMGLLRKLLSDPGKTYLYYGVDNLFPDVITVLTDSESARRGMEDLTIQNLASLSKMASLSVNDRTPVTHDVEPYLSALDEKHGIRFDFPNPFKGEFGVSTLRGTASYRAVHAVYQATRLKELTTGQLSPRLLEIGGGIGRTCYYAHRLGLRNYTIVDLPMTLMGQACFLAATLGEHSFVLPGETPTSLEHAAIRLATPSQFEHLGNFDVALNMDSLPEMSHAQVRRYFYLMRRQCGKLLSINHEDNNRFFVRDFERPAYRAPFELRPGYFEEIYTFRPRDAASLTSIFTKMTFRRMTRAARMLALQLRKLSRIGSWRSSTHRFRL